VLFLQASAHAFSLQREGGQSQSDTSTRPGSSSPESDHIVTIEGEEATDEQVKPWLRYALQS
jgi:hypothetical protein